MINYDRFSLDDMSLNELYDILVSEKYAIIFCCIEKDHVLYRYRLGEVKTLSDFKKLFERNMLRKFESGIDSGDINILESKYIDCYFKKYPIKW